MEYAGMGAITFQIAKPERRADEEGTARLVVVESGGIRGARVIGGNQHVSFAPSGDTVELDMRDIPPGTAVTVEVLLTMDGREHVVTVTVTAKNQDGEQGETAGGDQNG